MANLDFSAQGTPADSTPDFSSKGTLAAFSSQGTSVETKKEPLKFPSFAEAFKQETPTETVGGFFGEGLMGRAVAGLAERAAHATLAPEDQVRMDIEKKKQEAEAPPTPSVGESLKQMGSSFLEHPLDSTKELVKGIAKDPELLLPALWEATPVKLAALAEKMGAAAPLGRTVGTAVRGAAIGAGAEATAQAAEGHMNAQAVVNTGAMFGVMGAGAKVLKGGYDRLKAAEFISDKPVPKPIDPDYAKSKITEDETVSAVMARKKEADMQTFLAKDSKGLLKDATATAYEKARVARQAVWDNAEEGADRRDIAREARSVFNSTFETSREADHQALEKKQALIKAKRGITEPGPQEKIQEAAFRDTTTGEIIPSGIKHTDEGKAQEHLEQGFLTAEGKFVDRHVAARIAEANHADKLVKEPSIEDGLHTTDFGEQRLDALKEESPPVTEVEAKIQAVDKDIAKEDQNSFDMLSRAIEVVKDSMRNIRANERLAKIWSQDLTKAMPDPAERTKITRALEGEKAFDHLMTDKVKEEKVAQMSKGLKNLQADISRATKSNDEVLADFLKEKRDNLERIHDELLKRPSEEHLFPILESVKKRLAEIGEQAKKAGLIKELLDNYVTHVLDFSKSKLDPAAQQELIRKILGDPKKSKLSKDFTANRQFETLRELERAVQGTGVVVHTDIAIIAEAYEKSMSTAIIHRDIVEHFSKEIAPNDKPYFMPMEKSAEALKEGYIHFKGKGSEFLENHLIHPDLVDLMGFMAREKEPGRLLKVLGAFSHLSKALNTVGSLFHAYSLATVRAVINPAEALRELFTAGSGTRAAIDAFKHDGGDKSSDAWLRDGLMVTTEDVQKTIVADVGVFADKLLTKLLPADKQARFVQHITEPFDKHILQKLNTFTWDYMHAGQKLNVANTMLAKAIAKNPEAEVSQLRKEIARNVNNSFGGLDWLDVASQTNSHFGRQFALKAAGIEGREWAQILLFAPDWTVSTIRATTTALPKELMKPKNWKLREGVKGIHNPQTQGDLARRYVLNTAIAYLTVLNGVNMITAGRPIWENKDKTRVEFRDGTAMQPAKHSMEFAEWVSEPDKTAGNKMGFWLKALFIGTTGIAYPSPRAPKLKDPSAIGRLKAIGGAAMPFAAGAGTQAPEGQGWERAALSTLGMPIYGSSKVDRVKAAAKTRAERAKQRQEAKKK